MSTTGPSLNPNIFGPNETSAEIWSEQANFVGLTSLGSVCWGVMLAIWVLCLNILIPSFRRDRTRRDAFHIFFVTAMVIFAGLGNFCGLRVAQLSWVDDRNFPGGPNGFTFNYYWIPVNIVGDSAFTVATWFQDGFQLYRLMVFWNFNYWIGILPALVYLGSVSTSCVFLWYASTPDFGLFSAKGTAFIEAFYLLSVFLNVLITILIVSKVLWNQKAIRSVLGNQHAKMYTSIVAMLIESAALYSVVGLLFVGLFLTGNTAQFLFLPVLGGVGCIAPSLIIYRVASGRAWSREAARKVTTGLGPLEFAPRAAGASQSLHKSSNIPLTTMGSITDISKGSTMYNSKSYQKETFSSHSGTYA